ncbi:MAG: type II toxin-antitoxin system VapC family toxin [Candidatus Bipolaricaulota bacterium]|nr:type II toxin-antitoxin system VapC family toxin [Candidatus Bipolaricaulota bacterium]MCS7274454.1 type II toxin-antitoxin system VapC family toxin [Candidatus Bipolaricaulota bacterium]MDW8110883.1 type II toxin-antitoxin system VapC family toxin [Candidatus Bipolaricaulota bacterium]
MTGDARLSIPVLQLIRDPANDVYLSVISVWEAMVKYQLGRLPLPQAPDLYISEQRQRHKIASLALDELRVTKLAKLPALHKDPFDRMIICQAIQHGLTLASADSAVRAYSAHVLIVP